MLGACEVIEESRCMSPRCSSPLRPIRAIVGPFDGHRLLVINLAVICGFNLAVICQEAHDGFVDDDGCLARVGPIENEPRLLLCTVRQFAMGLNMFQW